MSSVSYVLMAGGDVMEGVQRRFLCIIIYLFCFTDGQVLSPSLGQALSPTFFIIPFRITYKQLLQMIMESTGDQSSPRPLPQ